MKKTAPHNRYLDWKLRHGLATRGHVGGRMHPKGLVAGVIYRLFFKKHDSELEGGPKVFDQTVGGALGPSGKMNGD